MDATTPELGPVGLWSPKSGLLERLVVLYWRPTSLSIIHTLLPYSLMLVNARQYVRVRSRYTSTPPPRLCTIAETDRQAICDRGEN